MFRPLSFPVAALPVFLAAAPAFSDHAGRIHVMTHDAPDGRVTTEDLLERPDGTFLTLAYPSASARAIRGADGAAAILQGTVAGIRVQGTLEGSTLRVLRMEREASVAAPEPAAAPAEAKVAVVLVSFPGRASPYTVTQMKTAFFGRTGRSVYRFYQEASYGTFQVVGVRDREGGDVFGPYVVSMDGCNGGGYAEVGRQARAAAQAAGVDMAAYDQVVHYLPPEAPGCPGGGVAGGQHAFIFGVAQSGAWDYGAHELAHCAMYGLGHASTWDNCTSASGATIRYGGACTHNEYGDQTDIMGGRNFRFCSYHLERMGWIPKAHVQELRMSARVTLAPLNAASGGIQSLRVPRGNAAFYHFEYRLREGFDAALETALTNGVLVRVTPGPGTRGNPHLLDMTPANNFRDATLVPGRTFVDSAYHLRVTTLSVGPQGALLEIILNNAPVSAAPERLRPVPGRGLAARLGLPEGAAGPRIVSSDGRLLPPGAFRDGRPAAGRFLRPERP